RIECVHILVVEDHADTRCALSRLLARFGYEVAAAENFHDAVQLLDNLRFDVLVSDLGLPDGDGLNLVGEARKRQPLAKTVALTARTSDEDRERGRRAGFDHYLTKPLEFEKLQGLLTAAYE
ncbi:MAG: response regulator, partial [Verrucomicrobiota bacterium]|nr:response regulator [Verrucomicrobiota bacterium]